MGKPLVYLIGAGPGDPGLITLKGMECVAKADVVLYDYLVNTRLLAAAREDAECIYVGKRGFDHHVMQDEINRILVDSALAGGGQTVARLKGGDPFIFGRGGEEALALREAGIDYEVVPGVTAGYAAPAYAGIPVTYRGISTDVAFVTGHEDPTKDVSGIDWEHLAGVGTICFYMGAKNLATIVGKLTEAGRAAETPVALIRWGTTPRQETLTGTLDDIVEKVRATGFKAPAITVVGDVVGLREQLHWYEDRPLFGKTIVVTRSRTQASELTEQLEALGAEVLEFPTIAVVDPEDWGPVDEAIKNLEVYEWVVFTSANGVDRFFDRLTLADKDGRAFAGARVACVGPATANRCIDRGIRPDYVPAEYRAEGVLEGFCQRGVGNGTRVLIPRALEAREVLPDTLRERGAMVDVVPAYRTVLGTGDEGTLHRLAEGSVDAVTFTSGSTARNFATLIEAAGVSLSPEVLVASIGPVTSESARKLGLTVGVEAAESTIPALVKALVGGYTSS